MYNVTNYELFLYEMLKQLTRIFCQFDILKDNYSSKPAFDVYRGLISDLDLINKAKLRFLLFIFRRT